MLAGEAKSRRNCRRKASYKTEQRARIVGQNAALRSDKSLWPYQCQHCREWHLTSHYQSSAPITPSSSGIFAQPRV